MADRTEEERKREAERREVYYFGQLFGLLLVVLPFLFVVLLIHMLGRGK